MHPVKHRCHFVIPGGDEHVIYQWGIPHIHIYSHRVPNDRELDFISIDNPEKRLLILFKMAILQLDSLIGLKWINVV
jgi:hypothetical protein